jgi:hypothetical protein
MRFCSAKVFCARKNASHFFLSGTKNLQLQPERYMPFALKVYEKLYNKNT